MALGLKVVELQNQTEVDESVVRHEINILRSDNVSHCTVEEHLSGEPQSSLIGRSEEGPRTDSSSLAFGAAANSRKTISRALTSHICLFGLADMNTHLE